MCDDKSFCEDTARRVFMMSVGVFLLISLIMLIGYTVRQCFKKKPQAGVVRVDQYQDGNFQDDTPSENTLPSELTGIDMNMPASPTFREEHN